jgi:pimeloyl-ACP methyl ester carboxylesterase
MTQALRHRVGDVILNYRIDGDGPEPLVCLHGVGSYLEAWSGVVEHLKSRFTILTFDLRGHGQSSKIKGRYDIDDFVNDTLALVRHVGFGVINLAGFSLGGLIAQRLALAYPDRVGRLVLLSTVAGRTPEERTRVRARLQALQVNQSSAHYDASLSRYFTETFQARHPELLAELRRRDLANDRDCFAAAYRVLAETDYGDVVDRIECPTLIVTGENDDGSNPRMARYMHERIRDSRLRILPGLRHSILIEAPALVGSTMADFLGDVIGYDPYSGRPGNAAGAVRKDRP